MQIRILSDFTVEDDPTPAVSAGTVVEATIDPEFEDAWYAHPITGETWFSFTEDWEIVK